MALKNVQYWLTSGRRRSVTYFWGSSSVLFLDMSSDYPGVLLPVSVVKKKIKIT